MDLTSSPPPGGVKSARPEEEDPDDRPTKKSKPTISGIGAKHHSSSPEYALEELERDRANLTEESYASQKASLEKIIGKKRSREEAELLPMSGGDPDFQDNAGDSATMKQREDAVQGVPAAKKLKAFNTNMPRFPK